MAANIMGVSVKDLMHFTLILFVFYLGFEATRPQNLLRNGRTWLQKSCLRYFVSRLLLFVTKVN